MVEGRFTGHSGFKGSWLCLWLKSLGAEVTGFAQKPSTVPSMFDVADVGEGMTSMIGDVHDKDARDVGWIVERFATAWGDVVACSMQQLMTYQSQLVS